MQYLLAALLCFAILTLWVPGYWPLTVFQLGIFALAGFVGFLTLWRGWVPHPEEEPGREPNPLAKPLHRVTQGFVQGISFTDIYPCFPLAFAAIWSWLQWKLKQSLYPFDTQVAALNWASLLAVFLVAHTVLRKRSARRWFRSALLWFGFVLAVLSTLQTVTSGGSIFWIFPSGYTDYVMGPFLNRNIYASFMELLLPLALYEALYKEHETVLYSGIAAVMYASVIASASRAGTVLTTAEILLVVALAWVRGRLQGSRIGGVLLRMAVLFGVFVAVVGWEAVWARFWQPDPMQVRRELNMSSLSIIKEHPWSGTGMGTWPTIYPHYAVIDIGAFANQAHNDWLQWTVEGGVVFGLLMLSLFGWSVPRAIRTVWGVGLLSVFLHATVDYPFFRPTVAAWPVVVMALLATDARAHSAPSS
jgi:O-antigen ligase